MTLTIGDAPAWPLAPELRGVAHGIPGRMDRLRALGNAVVPQCAEVIGRLIVEAMTTPQPSRASGSPR